MSNTAYLEESIASDLGRLRSLLSRCSTRSVAGWCYSYHLKLANQLQPAQDRLLSPARQIPLLLDVLLSQNEPEIPSDFGKDEWKEAKSLLDSLFSAYILLYMPSEENLGPLSTGWNKVREVSMLAFFHFFNTGLIPGL